MKKLLVLLVVAIACLSLPASATCSNPGTYFSWAQTNGTEASAFIAVQGTCTFKPIEMDASLVNDGSGSNASLVEVEEANSCTNLLGVILFQNWLAVTSTAGSADHAKATFPGSVGDVITSSLCVHFSGSGTGLAESFLFSYALQ